MKKAYNWLLMMMFAFTSCGTVHYVTPSVNFITEDSGKLTLRSFGLSDEKYNAIAEAEKNAIREVLFFGIPCSQYKDAIIADTEKSAKDKNPQYFKELFDNNGFKSFIISSVPTTDKPMRVKGKKIMTTDVVINVKALRQDLERNNIIRKFGY